MKIKALKNTIFKLENEPSEELERNEKIDVEAGTILEACSITLSKNQHLKIVLECGLNTCDSNEVKTVFIYEPHWQLPDEFKNKSVKLDVKYRTQIDNSTNLFGTGYRQCNLTSNAMALDYCLLKHGLKGLEARAKEGGYVEAESVYAQALKKHGDTIYHEAQTSALKEFSVESYFSTTLTQENVFDSLENGYPVVASVSYKSSGHVILIVGYDQTEKFYWVHDPYGCRAGSSNSYVQLGGIAGKYDKYSFDCMQDIWGDVGTLKSGWGRIITKVNGQPTGN